VAHVRSQATAWQIDPDQIGVAGADKGVPDYRKLGATFAVCFGGSPDDDGAGTDENVKRLPPSSLGAPFDADTAWLRELIAWLTARKAAVF